jgi:large subunit ribosomal protein L25
MHDISLKLQKREAHGKKVGVLRQEGFVPSVVYGGHDDPISTQSPDGETAKVVHEAGKHTPVHLTIDGKKKLAIIKAIEVDPVKHHIRHIAFHAIKQNDVITTEVPIVLNGIGESAAEKVGLIILQALESVEVKAKPADLPESLELSVLDLTTDEDKLTLADITLPEGVEYADVDQDLDLVIANVYEPAALEAANEAAAGDAVDETEVTEDEAANEEADDGSAEAEKPEQK